jgi:hypothetical protein
MLLLLTTGAATTITIQFIFRVAYCRQTLKYITNSRKNKDKFKKR